MKLEKYLVNYLETMIVMKNLMIMKWIQLTKVTMKRTLIRLMTQNGEIIIDLQKNIECLLASLEYRKNCQPTLHTWITLLYSCQIIILK